jgi:SpoVK/Ycf46/Vps4 family AAA+-type ATPase
MAPGYDEDDVLCIARDAATVERLNAALTEFAERPAGRCLHYAEGWKSAPHLDEEIGKVTWDDLVLAPALLSSVRESVEGFFHHRDAYSALGFPWRRGILLVGPPGTGKTMICKAAAAAVPDWPFLYVRDLREYHEEDAIKAIFERARKLAPCILTFEDMDGLVSDANRTVFLNELDGFHNNEGMLIIASSNHPEKIDEALLKRPSRFDRVFHVGLPAAAERRTYCLSILSRSSLAERLCPSLDPPMLAGEVARLTEGFTPAYLKEVFVGAALQRAQAGAMTLDGEFARAVMGQVDALRTHLRRMRDPEALAEMGGSDSVVGFRRHMRREEE